MSVVQHIRDRAGRFRWMGLLVVWAVFIAMAAVLLVERAGVQYSAGQHKLGMLAANDAVPASSAIFGQKPTCLVITDSDQAGQSPSHTACRSAPRRAGDNRAR